MDLSEYKDTLTGAVAAAAASDEKGRAVLETLVRHLRDMDLNDKYMQDAWRAHGELTNDSQSHEALESALTTYRSYDEAEQLPTVFLIDLVDASRPEGRFL